jgi:hypothetical protein
VGELVRRAHSKFCARRRRTNKARHWSVERTNGRSTTRDQRGKQCIAGGIDETTTQDFSEQSEFPYDCTRTDARGEVRVAGERS